MTDGLFSCYYGRMRHQRILSTFVILAFGIGALYSLEPPENRPEWQPAGPVLEVEEVVLHRNSAADTVPARETPVLRARFSPGGRIISLVRYAPDANRPVTQTFSYDDSGRLEQWTARTPEKAVLWEYRYRYTEQGRILQETEFDRFGRVAGNRAYLYHHEDNGTRTEESAYNEHGEVLWWMQRFYSFDAREESWSMYYPDGRIITEGLRRFDAQERVIHEEEIDRATGNRTITAYQYGQGDNPVLVEHLDSLDSVHRRDTFEYDQYGNITLHRQELPAENRSIVRRFDYQYDRFGNWTQRISWRIVTENGTLQNLEHVTRERRFVYHEEQNGE